MKISQKFQNCNDHISYFVYSRSTVLVKLEKGNNAACDFEPGDHLAIFPSNEATMVEKLIGQLNNAPDADKPIRLQISKEASGTYSWQ